MTKADSNNSGRSFEWWMFSFIGAGAGWAAFISLLIPPYVTESTGNAADAGIVMAIISLAAVLAPVLGGFADKYRAHRLVLSLGVLGMAIGFLMYSISAEATALYALDAIVLGISAAAINAVGPVFVSGRELISGAGGQAIDGPEPAPARRPGDWWRTAGRCRRGQSGFRPAS